VGTLMLSAAGTAADAMARFSGTLVHLVRLA
jgi:hypothetical protein